MKFGAFVSSTLLIALLVSGCGSQKDTASPQTQTQQETPVKSDDEAKKKAEEEAKAKAEEEAKKKAEEEAKAEEEEKYKNAFYFINEVPRIDKELFDNEGAEVSDKSIAFLKANVSLFPAWKPELKKEVDQKVDASVTYKHLDKNLDKHLEKFFKVTGYIVDIQEYQADIGEVSYIHVINDSGESFVFLYPGTGELFKEDRVTAVGTPLISTHFSNVSGGTTRVIIAACSYIVKSR
ncbi:hypothetical protein HN020_09175 [Brevibacillus borstelensis]|nr:hypothetical protein [Brevibacillus borstelensis]NOU54919.1 hypothetical protein [Brevibacillus borstelensis]